MSHVKKWQEQGYLVLRKVFDKWLPEPSAGGLVILGSGLLLRRKMARHV